MRRDAVMRVALWLVETGSADGEAFAGDLLEMFAAGRSRWWCVAQAVCRAVFAIERRLRYLSVPLCYTIGFVLLHPLWQRLSAPPVSCLLARYRGTSSWPSSAVLEIVAGVLPGALFVGVGILVYVRVRRQSLFLRRVAALLSLHVGLCLLCLAMMVRLLAMRHDLRLLSRTDFYYPLVHGHFSILLFVSLFGAVLALPVEENIRRSVPG